jgi:hypothetical protein
MAALIVRPLRERSHMRRVGSSPLHTVTRVSNLPLPGYGRIRGPSVQSAVEASGTAGPSLTWDKRASAFDWLDREGEVCTVLCIPEAQREGTKAWINTVEVAQIEKRGAIKLGKTMWAAIVAGATLAGGVGVQIVEKIFK